MWEYKYNHEKKSIQKIRPVETKEKKTPSSFVFGSFSDTVGTFEKQLVALPSLISRDPENIQLNLIDLKNL